MTTKTEKDLLAGVFQRAFNGSYQTIHLDNQKTHKESLIAAMRIEKIAVDMGYSVRYQFYLTGLRKGLMYRAEFYWDEKGQSLPAELISLNYYEDNEPVAEPEPFLTDEERKLIQLAIPLLQKVTFAEGLYQGR